ncbi:phytanoyl-CoA dioxygenase, peroxisomal-like [Ostrinia furnacalis]|uniref:phytanoyl-CoA dioxygenase, peroxisomal-like n=1 Tax=Ostrinia furnacalis TaxID=93504 RepID=UPI0010405023|nr:phytanoyl-CoA dioxygenase, peroxisomal-like [Ostrinia furnacalis]
MSSRKLGDLKVTPKKVFAELPETYEVSKEQLKFYDDNGYLVIKQLIDFGSLYSYKKQFSLICNGVIPRGNVTIVKEANLVKEAKKAEDYVNKLQDILYDDVFASYIEHPRLLNVVSQFIGDNVSAMHTMLINKPPGTGRHPPHQDIYYFPFRPAHKIIAAWTAIDDVTIDNGCLYVLPGSHRGELHSHGYPEKFMRLYHGIIEEDTIAPENQRVNLEMSPGDTVFFHPHLVHGSRPNVSKGFRKSISCHYASSDCHFIDVTGTVQEKIAEESIAEAKRRGIELTYEEIWRYRSKHVKGVRSNL